MKERLKLYFQLIQQLLVSPEEELELLEANSDLGFVLDIGAKNALSTAESEQAKAIRAVISYFSNLIQQFPEQWAITQINLGNAYLERIEGERAENLETAIACYEDALIILTQQEFPEQWAITQIDLGNAYSDRIEGERAENLETAIACYEDALIILTQQEFPELWAITQNNLGNAYLERIEGERAENLETAIARCEDALKIYTEQEFPEQWAITQNNLAIASILLG